MEPIRQYQNAFAVAGLSVRTTNREEIVPGSGRIPGLWARFFGENVMGRTPHRDTADLRNFGVYSGYESDAHGAFDVTAGVAVTEGATVQVEAGDYLVFNASGVMPQAVLDAWAQVWQYFEAHPEVKRRYRSDFEAYTSPVSAVVCIGVESA
ncbi:GyrI-like domain-containing protein [Variovorax fucosicus]|uniref:GyrI-like domain-containing protein n=1 Tax=Variovorax fucosicus TaxID=3053517 RepID=UPI0025750AB0|nr:effector binding domain-containing protein [Variovorax sp. J22G47]MDM0058734.1 effector binding domain-containing protein [Variovorax sp. J22G47]